VVDRLNLKDNYIILEDLKRNGKINSRIPLMHEYPTYYFPYIYIFIYTIYMSQNSSWEA